MKTQFIGNIRVDAVSDLDYWPMDPEWLFGDATKAEVAEHAGLLGPRMVEPDTNRLILSCHSFLIRTPHHTILFDTCFGNHKDRGGLWPFHQLSSAFLDNLRKLGVAPEKVDYVMCSHLHTDHVGWNTRLENGEWVPTFPNAKYVISRGEFEWWQEAVKSGEGSAISRAAFADSVLPIVDRGLAVLVEDDHRLEDTLPDEVAFLPLHGHTAHHCGLHLRSGRDEAILAGDGIHHPIQFIRQDWVQAGFDKEKARNVLRALIERCLDTSTRLLTAHFPAPTAGRVVSQGDRIGFLFDEE